MFNASAAGKAGADTTITAATYGTAAETQDNDPRFVQLVFR